MAAIGDFEIFGGRTFRFQASAGINAWRPWSPWGDLYTDASLAAAKLQVPIDGSLDEKVIGLIDTTAGTIHVFVQEIAGYGIDFDASFLEVLNTSVTFINEDTIGPVLATIDISSLFGMTSNSAAVEASIVDAAVHAVILAGITAGALSTAVTDSHTQNTDTGTTQTSFKVAEGVTGKEAELDAQNLTANTNLDLERIDDNLNGASNAMPIITKTKATALTEAAVLGQTVFISDIDGSKGFVLTYDGTDFISGLYFFQDASNTIATAPSVGGIFAHLNTFWECIDSTTDKEVFVITTQKAVFNKTVTGNIEENEAKGGIITNTGAAGNITLTFTAAAETEGAHCTIVKTDSNQMVINDSGAVLITQNLDSGTGFNIGLTFVNGGWVKNKDTNFWT